MSRSVSGYGWCLEGVAAEFVRLSCSYKIRRTSGGPLIKTINLADAFWQELILGKLFRRFAIGLEMVSRFAARPRSSGTPETKLWSAAASEARRRSYDAGKAASRFACRRTP
jgi:hypothetical protein